jgi:hypothetical protein
MRGRLEAGDTEELYARNLEERVEMKVERRLVEACMRVSCEASVFA